MSTQSTQTGDQSKVIKKGIAFLHYQIMDYSEKSIICFFGILGSFQFSLFSPKKKGKARRREGMQLEEEGEGPGSYIFFPNPSLHCCL